MSYSARKEHKKRRENEILFINTIKHQQTPVAQPVRVNYIKQYTCNHLYGEKNDSASSSRRVAVASWRPVAIKEWVLKYRALGQK